MIRSEARARVLIIGAGFRAANNFLPALRLCAESFEVVGILARSTERSEPLGKLWDVPVYRSLAEVDPRGVDTVAVTVPTNQNAAVLSALLAWNKDVSLTIDTPIAWNFGEYRALLPLLLRFKAVVVAEDFMNFPQFELARTAVRSGLCGRVRSVTLFNTGYRYHGLALLRSFTDFAPVLTSWRFQLGGYSSVVAFRFSGGMVGYIVGPYRQVVTGGILVEGDSAIVTQAAEDVQFTTLGSRKLYHLASSSEPGREDAFVLEGSDLRLATPEFSAMSAMPFEDRTPLNVYKNVGLTRIFRSLIVPDALNRPYGFQNALYDSFASRFAFGGRLRFDPLARVGSNFMALPRLAITRSLRG
jgi:hypothetical protein